MTEGKRAYPSLSRGWSAHWEVASPSVDFSEAGFLGNKLAVSGSNLSEKEQQQKTIVSKLALQSSRDCFVYVGVGMKRLCSKYMNGNFLTRNKEFGSRVTLSLFTSQSRLRYFQVP